MRKSLLSHIGREELEELYHNQNYTEAQLAQRYNVSRGSVRHRIRQLGISTKGRGGKPWPKELTPEKLADLYEKQRLSIAEIKKIYGVCHKTLNKKLDECSIIRDRGRYRTELDEELMKTYYCDWEFSLTDTAAMFDVSPGTIKDRLEQHGVLIRSPQHYLRRYVDGDRRKEANGYVSVYLPDDPNANGGGWVLEHRLVMSEKLGRPLCSDEEVHHRNGVRYDNRLENLELWALGHPNGQRVTDKIKWAKEFLEKNGYKVVQKTLGDLGGLVP